MHRISIRSWKNRKIFVTEVKKWEISKTTLGLEEPFFVGSVVVSQGSFHHGAHRRNPLRVRSRMHTCIQQPVRHGEYESESHSTVTPSTFLWTWPTLCLSRSNVFQSRLRRNVAVPLPTRRHFSRASPSSRAAARALPAPDRYITKYSCSWF